MKQLLVISFLLFSFGAAAQTANFKSADAKQIAGIHTQFNCTLTGIDPGQVQAVISAMKATPGLLKLDVLSTKANSAELRIVTVRENDSIVLQNAFTAANVNSISVDDKEFKTANLNKVIEIKN